MNSPTLTECELPWSVRREAVQGHMRKHAAARHEQAQQKQTNINPKPDPSPNPNLTRDQQAQHEELMSSHVKAEVRSRADREVALADLASDVRRELQRRRGLRSQRRA